MSPQPCYCINPHCQRPDDPSSLSNNFCISCGSSLILNGKYRVKKLLSNDSGFGIIYEAESHQSKILKVLKPEHNNSIKVIELFKQEYQVLYNLTRQKIAGIPQVEPHDYFQYQTGTSVILHCIIMEKVEGINLEEWIDNHGQISQKKAIKWLKEITQILAKIHEKKYFHRDIKPPNVMRRNNGELVLIDFGTAREQTQTYYQQLQKQNITGINSQGYTPEEQKNGQAVIQSDFFALGRTFVHLLTGKYPLNMYDGYSNVLKWREYTTNINPLLLDLIDELMAESANKRPANTRVILQRLNQIETAINIPQTQQQPQSSNKSIYTIISLLLLIGGGYGIINNMLNQHPQVAENPINEPSPTVQPTAINQPSPVVQETPINRLTATDYFNEGLKYYKQKEYEQAIASYNKAIELEPNYAFAYNNRGLAYENLKEFNKAIADYNQAIEINPQLTKAYNNRGLVYQNLKEYEQAIADYNKAIEINPNYAEPYNNRGFIYDDLKEYEQAIADYNKAIEINPNSADTYYNRGFTYSNLKEYEKAIADYNKSIEINPDSADTYYSRGVAYKMLENSQSALSDFRQAAILYQQQGNTEDYNDAENQIRELGG